MNKSRYFGTFDTELLTPITMINSRVLIFCTVFFFAACSSNDQPDSSGDQASTERNNEISERDSREIKLEPLKLNDGNPWEVSEVIYNRVTSMQNMVSEVLGAEKEADYRILANSLDQQVNTLLKYSSEEGSGGEELNIWLRRLNIRIRALREAPDAERAREATAQIGNSFKEFESYFQLRQ